MSEKRSLAEIEKDILKAADELELKRAVSAAAGRDETQCLNTLNALQREFDAALEELQQSSPSSSDWGRRARRWGEPT